MKVETRLDYLFDVVVSCWRFITTMVLLRHDWVCTVSGFIFTRLVLCSGSVPCISSTHCAPSKKATVPIYKVLVRPGQESNSRSTSTKADALSQDHGLVRMLITRKCLLRGPIAPPRKLRSMSNQRLDKAAGRKGKPATIQTVFFSRRQVNMKSLMKTLTLHMIVIKPLQCNFNRNK